MSAIEIMSTLGGVVTFLGGVGVVVRAVFRQVTATEENTDALTRLAERVEELWTQHNNHEIRLGILEDRLKR